MHNIVHLYICAHVSSYVKYSHMLCLVQYVYVNIHIPQLDMQTYTYVSTPCPLTHIYTQTHMHAGPMQACMFHAGMHICHMQENVHA